MSILKSTSEETFFVSEALASRMSHWLEDSSKNETILDEIQLQPDDCLITASSIKIVFPIVGWNFLKKTVTLIVPTERLRVFSPDESINLSFFGKEYILVKTSSVKEDNLWKVTVHFKDKENI